MLTHVPNMLFVAGRLLSMMLVYFYSYGSNGLPVNSQFYLFSDLCLVCLLLSIVYTDELLV